jgi:signal transduction histidine kinase
VTSALAPESRSRPSFQHRRNALVGGRNVKKKLRVLLVEDDPGDAHLTRKALSQLVDPKFEIDQSDSLAGAKDRLGSSDYDVALLDLGLPESSGIETLARFNAICAEPVPVIVLTNLEDEQAALRTLDEGAQDYLIKSQLRPDTLSRAIRYAVQRQQMFAQLQSANEQLDAKNVRLSELYNTAQQFVDNVSHEFRTPLTVIREFTSIVRDGYDGPVTAKQIEHLDKVLHRTDDLALMVDDMLDISKLEAGLLGVWRRPTNVAELVRNVVGLLRARADCRKIRLTTRLADALPTVFCDEEKAQRVLINLTMNAIKFTPEGGTVEVWAQYDQERNEVTVGVTDSGSGICQSNLELIFQRFRQIETNLRASTKGFGLGLNIAKELVRLNLGRIEVESEVGKGSTFRFTLPVNEPAEVLDRFVERRSETAEETPWIVLARATYDARYATTSAPVVDEFLQRSVRSNDLVLPINERTWLMAISCAERDAPAVFQRLLSSWRDYARNDPSAELPPVQVEQINCYSCDRELESLRADWQKLIHAGPSDHSVASGTTTILVVDDDKEVNDCLGLRLAAAGYNVLSAYDGEEGLSAALECHPDAVVLDVRMPKKDGLSMLRELRTEESLRQTPVVMLSASVRDQHRALEAGANYFVAKPYESKDLLSAIESSLTKGPAHERLHDHAC